MPNFILKFSFQVQGELKRKWRSIFMNCYLSRARHSSNNFTSRNGSEHAMQFHRNSRAQSILQSETTMLWGVQNIHRFTPPAPRGQNILGISKKADSGDVCERLRLFTDLLPLLRFVVWGDSKFTSYIDT